MNKSLKIMMILLFIVTVGFNLTGCSLHDKIEEYSQNKVQGYLNIENVTQFSYEESNYTILEDTVLNSNLGEWIGYIRQLVAVDEAGKIVFQENIESTTIKTLKELKDKVPEAAYIISFLNVYADLTTDNYLIVQVNGENHKAILNENIKDTDKVFQFKKNRQSSSGKFTISPINATQLLCDGKVYQVTSDTVLNDELGIFIDILAKSVTFDDKTKIPISKEELNKIDRYGTNSKQDRKEWFYNDIYEIYGTNQKDAIAVNINNSYYVAKKIE